jgi:hypothetical protein
VNIKFRGTCKDVIAVRIEKLKFIAEEMQLAFLLATHAPDDFTARTLARHILIRAKDFIEHARALRRPLNAAGYNTRDFHKTKEAYAAAFDEYFKISRDRLGAHVQDFDFGKRLDLWNDIEVGKLGFFVDGAIELYRSLAGFNIPGYAAWADAPELSDAALLGALRVFQRAQDHMTWTELGTDPLAMTRQNTSAILNLSPVHARAGQLALIRRWITIQSSLLTRLAGYGRITRILKVRIITDIVSFCDCLVTRAVSPGAPQEMDGLDRLIAANGQSAAPITDFVAASHFDSELRSLRGIRDKIGAHLEVDAAYTLEALFSDLDGYDLENGIAIYELVSGAFTKVCFAILYLRMYAADGRRLYGVTGGGGRAVPFAGETVASPRAPPPPLNDEAAYRRYLTRWLDGDETQRGDARQFFWNAFQASESIEQIDEVEAFGGGNRGSRNEFRKAHAFIGSTLAMEISESDFGGILDLILSCRSGWPYPLAEVLVRAGNDASEWRQALICYALGEIGSFPHASATGFLRERTKSSKWGMRFAATLALFKTFMKSEGVYRINHQGRATADYKEFVESLTGAMTPPELLLALLAFASILSGPGWVSFAKPFEGDYAALQARIEALCIPCLKDGAEGAKSTILKQLIQTHDYVGVCLLLAVELEHDPRTLLRDALLDNCCNGSIVTAMHDQAIRHKAMCFYLKKQHAMALDIARGIATRNPDMVNAQILVAQILADMPGSEDEAARDIAKLRRSYKLDAASEAILAAAEQEIAKRKAS